MTHLLFLLILGLLMHGARSYAPAAGMGGSPGETVLGAGFLLLAAYLSGALFKQLRLPKLTGYLVCGMIAGPEILGFVTGGMLADLKIFNGLATALIALSAGTELEIQVLRPLFRTIRRITLVGILGTIAILSVSIYLLRGLLPFMNGLDALQLGVISTVLGVVLAAQSPAVVVALRKEMEAEGPLTRTVLGLVVVAEMVVVLLYTIFSVVAKAVLGGGGTWSESLVHMAVEIPGSLATGAVIGWMIAFFMRRVENEGALFIVTLGFLIAEVGSRLGFDILLVALAAGVIVQNCTGQGHRLHADVEAGSLPVFVTFFSVAGASLHLSALASLMAPVLIFVAVRAASYLAGGYLGARLAGSPDVVRKYAGFGMLPQAGLALSLAILFTKQFPLLGDAAGALIFGVVTVNELISPVLYRWALVRSGEASSKMDAPLEQIAPEEGAETA
jgi:Kef-type K+ transport system membrane component KefB